MRSARPKPLHPICGRPMVLHVIHAVSKLRPERTVIVVGHGSDAVTRTIEEHAPGRANVAFAEQAEQKGTGHAALIGTSALEGDDYDEEATVIVCPGDTPLLDSETLEEFVATHVANGNAATLLTSVVRDPTGYGRVIRAGDQRVLRVVEQRDAEPSELDVREVNTSIYAFRRDLLGPALRNLDTDNAQHEFYLTDVIGQLADLGHRIGAVQAPEAETQGVNDRWQLALAERELRNRTNRHWLLNGVTMLDPRQTFIDVTVTLGRDVTIYPGTILQGSTAIGDRCDIGPATQLTDVIVGTDCNVAHSVAAGSKIGDRVRIGPFAYLPAGSAVASDEVTGPFYTGD